MCRLLLAAVCAAATCATADAQYEIRNVRKVGQVTRAVPGASASASTSQLPGGVLSINRELTVTNEFSVGFGLNNTFVSANVGFNVSWSAKTGYQYQTRPLPPKKTVTVTAYNVYDAYTYDVWLRPAFSNRFEKVGSGTALKFAGVRFVETVR